MDVQKREDRLLDKIGELLRQRDMALDWISIMVENGDFDVEMGEFLSELLKGGPEE